ncbi:MAG TPA: hypothetical protein VHE30_22215 [Polyangiaceae bacterium]|nr:hypothetical protein [Polyangiaceae bacterium]
MPQHLAKIVLVAALMAANSALTPALARMPFGAGRMPSPTDYPGAPRPVYPDEVKLPYAMNYADEAVESLGFKNGHMDLFSTKPSKTNPYLPTFSGGLGGDGAMLKLQWHPGE